MKFEALTLFENFNLSFSRQSEIYIYIFLDRSKARDRYTFLDRSKKAKQKFMLINFDKSGRIEEWSVGRVEETRQPRENRGGGLLRGVLVYEYRGGYRVRNALVDCMPRTCYWFCPRKLITPPVISSVLAITINRDIDRHSHSFSKSAHA